MENQIFLKVTNKEEVHHGYKYHHGLNILDKPFEPTGSNVAGGLYFTTPEHIHKFYSYGIYLRVVKLPLDDPEFQMIIDPSLDKYRANRIILAERYSLYNPETYSKFGLDISQNRELIDLASANGDIDILEWWKFSKVKLSYSSSAINLATVNGRIEILEWWRTSGLELKYDSFAINAASELGLMDVLEWWRKSGLKLRYTTVAFDAALVYDRIDVLVWWLKSGLKIKYSKDAMKFLHDRDRSWFDQWKR